MKITVIGAGYVGLCTAAGIASFGNDVTCVDNDTRRIAQLRLGKTPIYEPGLDELIKANVEDGRLHFSSDSCDAILRSDVIFIAVGTPSAPDGAADLSAVYSVAREIGATLKKAHSKQKVIAIKSTVPVGTTEKVSNILSSFIEEYACVASNPEFLREGTAVEDFMRPDRIVIGTHCDLARDTLLHLYRPFTSVGKVLVMDPASAELVKYTSNALLAVRIAFMNEIAALASAVGANVNHVREAVGRDIRIGPKYLYPGPGYGGACLPKDVAALINFGEIAGVNMSVAEAAQTSNDAHKLALVNQVATRLGTLKGKKIAVWGLAFKAETDDIRESPAISFIDGVLANGATVSAHDPKAMSNAQMKYEGRVEFNEDKLDCVAGADALVICTEWREYRSPFFSMLAERASNIIIFDARNLWDAQEAKSAGFEYHGMGTTEIIRK